MAERHILDRKSAQNEEDDTSPSSLSFEWLLLSILRLSASLPLSDAKRELISFLVLSTDIPIHYGHRTYILSVRTFSEFNSSQIHRKAVNSCTFIKFRAFSLWQANVCTKCYGGN